MKRPKQEIRCMAVDGNVREEDRYGNVFKKEKALHHSGTCKQSEFYVQSTVIPEIYYIFA